MSVTRLKRKHRKNIARANNKQTIIKQLMLTPVLKNVDIEELKAKFPNTGAATSVASAPKEAATAVKEAATSLVDKVKKAAVGVADAVSNSEVVEKAKEVVGDIVEKVQDAVSSDDTDATKENAEAFDDAEAVTKPVNEDGQEGEHPKPEIAL